MRKRYNIIQRKRSRELQEQLKAQLMASLGSGSFFSSNGLAASKKMRSSPFFSIACFFESFAGKEGSPDSDSMRSPTSPLDHYFFTGVGTSSVHSPRSPGRSWDCSRIGLGLLDTLIDDPESKSILLGSQMRASNISWQKTTHLSDDNSMTRSLFSQLASNEKIESCCPTDKPREIYHNSNSDVFVSDSKSSQVGSIPSIRGHLEDSKRWTNSLPVSVGSIHCFMVSAREVELSEDYTCIISHGPIPKTTHIFGDCISENHMMESLDSNKKQGGEGGDYHWIVKCSENSPPLPSNDFLSFCFSCKKKLEEGKDIYMYRGEKRCCDLVTLLEEQAEMEKPETCSGDSPTSSSFHECLIL